MLHIVTGQAERNETKDERVFASVLDALALISTFCVIARLSSASSDRCCW